MKLFTPILNSIETYTPVQHLLKKIEKVDWLKVWGFSFFVLVCANLIISNFFEGRDYKEVFWFCNIMSFYLAYGFYFKKAAPVNAALALSLTAQGLWILDFFLEAFGNGLGRTSLLVSESALYFTVLLSLLMHSLIIPMSIWGTFKLGFTYRAREWMIAILLILLPATYLFTDPFGNRNCVFYPCDLTYPQALLSGKYLTLSYFVQTEFFWIIADVISFYVLYVLFWKKRIK